MVTLSRIAELRQRKGWTQQELADRVKVTEPTIATWESPSGSLWLERIVRLCDALNCQVKDLMVIQKNNSRDVQIAKLRKKAGLSQRELARKIGGTATTIANWERGLSGSDWIMQAMRLCDYLECEVKDLVDIQKEETLTDESDFEVYRRLTLRDRSSSDS